MIVTGGGEAKIGFKADLSLRLLIVLLCCESRWNERSYKYLS